LCCNKRKIAKTGTFNGSSYDSGKMNGRGAYIKKDLDVLGKAKKTRALAKCLEVEIPESVYEEIESMIKKETE